MKCHSRYSEFFYVLAIAFYGIHLLAHLIPALFVFAKFNSSLGNALHFLAEGPVGFVFAFSILPIIVWDFYIHRRHHIEIHARDHKIKELESKLSRR